jgi:Holliday junction resolvasome RuvABC endonuclease subunit
MLLALDIATSLGWCLGGPESTTPKFGTLLLPGVSQHNEPRSVAIIQEWVTPMVKMMGVKIVLIEAPFLKQGRDQHNVESAFFLCGVAMAAAVAGGAVYVRQNVQTVRKCFIGHGNLPRKEAKEAVMARWRMLGCNPKNDDEGDAGALWYWGMVTTYPKWSWGKK